MDYVGQGQGHLTDRLQLLDQLVVALGSFYVNLERKKAVYGLDPVRPDFDSYK